MFDKLIEQSKLTQGSFAAVEVVFVGSAVTPGA